MSIPDPKNKQNEYTFPVDCIATVNCILIGIPEYM